MNIKTCTVQQLLPKGKGYTDFFKKGSPNVRKFPKLSHHRTGKPGAMCISYQVLGKCQRKMKCSLAHTPKSKMSASQFDAIDKAFREIYGS